MSTNGYIHVLLAAAVGVGCCGCEESLPPREEPPEVVRVRLFAADTRLVVVDSMTVYMGGYIVRLALDNLYNDVLDAQALVRGNVRVWLRDHPDQGKNFVWDERDLLTPWVVHGATATLGIDSAAVLSTFWDFRTDAGEPFWNYTRFSHLYTPGGRSYYLSDSVHFSAEGSMQLFRNVYSRQALPITFAVVFHIWRESAPL